MALIEVDHEGGDRFAIRVRGHGVIVDQPLDAGGEDTGPTPTELWVASLAACVAFYAGRFLQRHAFPADGLAVTCDFTMSEDRPARVASIDLRVALPPSFPETRRAALLAVVEHCTVHNSMRIVPEVSISLDADERVA